MTVTVVSLEGGLGNQLFQYAAGLRRQATFGGDLLIETGFYDRLGRADRQFALRHFRIEPRWVETDALERLRPRVIDQDYTIFDRRPLDTPGDVLLRGTWASERFFADQAQLVRTAFTLADAALADYARAFVAAARRPGAPVIALHVRRGDNTHPDNFNKYTLMDPEYFRQAIAMFPAESSYIVFSDTTPDVDWCARHLTFPHPDRVTYSYDRGMIVDFALMMACDHMICDYSTFSWWAAWLNPSPGKQIVVPHPALGMGPRHAHCSSRDYWPAEHVVITLPPRRGDAGEC